MNLGRLIEEYLPRLGGSRSDSKCAVVLASVKRLGGSSHRCDLRHAIEVRRAKL